MLEETDFSTPKSSSQRVDIDLLCGLAWDAIKETSNPWIYHKCKTKGCSEGIVNAIHADSYIQQLAVLMHNDNDF